MSNLLYGHSFMRLVSVIIPTYNAEKTIKKTVESVLDQTYIYFEVIIINDGSTDKTLEIVEQIQDSRIRVYSYPNQGLAISRNRGIEQASGEYIAFLDADDLWTSDKLASQVEALANNPDTYVAYSWTDYIDETDQFFKKGSHISVSGNVYAQLLLIDFLENGSTPLIRRTALDQVGSFDYRLNPAEDWDMWLRLAAQYHFIAIPKVQVLYRVSSGSMSANIWKMEAGCTQVIEQSFQQVPTSLQYLKRYSLANIYRYLIYKALEGKLEKKRGLTTLRFVWQVIRHDFNWNQMRVMMKVFLKAAIAIVLPSRYAESLISRAGTWLDTSTILGYIKTEVPDR